MFFLDRLLKPLLTNEKAIEHELEFLGSIEKLREMSKGQLVWDYLDIIDAKAAALLTHISIFAALAAVLYTGAEAGTWEKHWLGAEFLAMCLVAIICLRCLRTLSSDSRQTPAEDDDELDYRLREGTKELIYRRRLFSACREAASILAFAVLVTEIVSYVQETFG